jgi:CRP-like cAMP-binding protein
MWAVVQLAQKMQYDKHDPVYWHGDLSDNFYFIHKGKVKLTTERGVKIISYSHGDMLGDSDALLGLPRDLKAVATTASTIYMVKMQ